MPSADGFRLVSYPHHSADGEHIGFDWFTSLGGRRRIDGFTSGKDRRVVLADAYEVLCRMFAEDEGAATETTQTQVCRYCGQPVKTSEVCPCTLINDGRTR